MDVGEATAVAAGHRCVYVRPVFHHVLGGELQTQPRKIRMNEGIAQCVKAATGFFL